SIDGSYTYYVDIDDITLEGTAAAALPVPAPMPVPAPTPTLSPGSPAPDPAPSTGTGTIQETMKVSGRFLYDSCGEKVILRGFNKMVVWEDWTGVPRDGMPAYTEIKKTGANSVRIVWVYTENTTAAEMDAAISNAIKTGLIPIIEIHNQTCQWSHEAVQTVTNYWTSPEILRVIQKHQRYLLLNFANEMGDFYTTDDSFRSEYAAAIKQMRVAGIHVPIIIDGSQCGQDIGILQRTGPWLTEQDPDHNLMFSLHIYWTDNDPLRITKAITDSVNMNLPLMIGEFANAFGASCNEPIAYKTIIKECTINEIGYLPWSWDPQNGCPNHSMTRDDTYDGLWGWGLEVAVTDPYSIKNTSVTPYSVQNGGSVCR
ncbi:MAG: cellulase family glycosylhydrolase, partial [Oligoflexales bacterium]|nr:cellulase family glycosylhydrolase [Oligoflexales bacterium]